MKTLALLLATLFFVGCGDDVRIVNSSCKCKKKCKDKKAEVALAQDTWYVTDLIDTPPITTSYHQWQATMNALAFSSDGVEKYILAWEALGGTGTPYEIKVSTKRFLVEFYSEEPPGAAKIVHPTEAALKDYLHQRDVFWHQQ